MIHFFQIISVRRYKNPFEKSSRREIADTYLRLSEIDCSVDNEENFFVFPAIQDLASFFSHDRKHYSDQMMLRNR